VTLVAPLGLIGLIALGGLLLLYLLKARFRDQVVGSIYLWQQVRRDLAVHEPWQRPRFSLLLLIQAAILVLLALGLARPALLSAGTPPEFAVLVLDSSASMRAADVAPDRFAAARDLARDRVRELSDGSRFTVILAGTAPRVLVAETDDRAAVLEALASADGTDGSGDMAAALRMAVALARGHSAGTVHVFSDGAYAPPAIETGAVPVRSTSVGGRATNRGIVAIDARAEPSNQRRIQLFVRVRNYDAGPARAIVALRTGEQILDSRTLLLDPEADATATFTDLPPEATIFEARLLDGDVLASDDRAWIAIDRREPTQILLVTAGNVFLEKILGLLPGAESYRVLPRRLGSIDIDAYDIIAYDGTTPDVLPRRPLFIVNPQDGVFLSISGYDPRPAGLVGQGEDPLLRFVDLRDVRVSRVARVTPPPWARVVATAEGSPAILAGEYEGRRTVVFLFDVRNSTLPLAASFPILMSNVVGYLEPPATIAAPLVRPGQAIDVALRSETQAIRIESGSGVVWSGSPRGLKETINAPSRVGLYQLVQAAGTRVLGVDALAVNLADPEESDPRPRAGTLESAGQRPDLPPASFELTFAAIVAVCGLLLLEWWWFHRRA